MNRHKKHKVKIEKPETSTSYTAADKDYDLAYYIHDRVELMHQAFSILKPKDLKAMAPECVRHISLDDLQELCTEELLGISSKRLCAILDGAEPPSDTESSSESPERFETISLDSISSDEEILSESSSKKNKKHKRHSKTKSKKSKKVKAKAPSSTVGGAGAADVSEESRASRAGLTVLELLELQARARAIRAQLHQDQANRRVSAESTAVPERASDNEVEIKEEPPDVVEISSDDEKPDIRALNEKSATATPQPEKTTDNEQTTTKRVSDLIITVPHTKQSRKIKLNRSKITVSVSNTDKTVAVATDANTNTETVITDEKPENNSNIGDKQTTKCNKEPKKVVAKTKEKQKKKQKKSKKKEEKDSDHDEITLQLSDTEKMDLLEDLDRKNFDNVSSSGSEDSESSSSDSSEDDTETVTQNNKNDKVNDKQITHKNDKINDKQTDSLEVTSKTNGDQNYVDVTVDSKTEKNISEDNVDSANNLSKIPSDDVEVVNQDEIKVSDDVSKEKDKPEEMKSEELHQDEESQEKPVEISTIDDIPVVVEEETPVIDIRPDSPLKEVDKTSGTGDQNNKNVEHKEDAKESDNEKEMSEGELSDRASSEVEAFDLQPEVVCISDTEEVKKAEKKKKKKKEKKSKKSKKSKSDFRISGDQNFYKESEPVEVADAIGEDGMENVIEVKIEEAIPTVSLNEEDYDDVYEILELSDDSSCYEVEGTVLSKEPTAEEIEALSAKIDEIHREDVVTEEEIREHERLNAEENDNTDELENISWKDRYLDSKKVKRVLTTSNIFNALRKKNRELKKKLEESKKEIESTEQETEKKETVNVPVLEGSIEQYNTLEGLTKYVNPVCETVEKVDEDKNEKASHSEEAERNGEETPQVVKEMRKDAKQLLKMYKRLLKYNDINKQKDPNKKKKKKSKKKNKDADPVAKSS